MSKYLPKSSLTILYISASVLLLLYSYTQVDLSLTLTREGTLATIQHGFQYIGYFMRPLSTALYVSLLAVFFVLYGIVLWLARTHRITVPALWRIILPMTILLIFAYPAFSYDIFNYMFTAKTVLVYHKNPYTVIPLNFVGIEPWLSFMRWTHLPSAYTPFWILLTLPAYALGFGYFLPVLWSIKSLVALFYLGSIWFTSKILHRLEPSHEALGMAILAFNPLVIIESLVSGHNDIVMMAIALFAYYLSLRHQPLWSYFLLALSVATKLMTVFLFPVALLGWRRGWLLVAISIGFSLVLLEREVLPWYFVWVVPFVALLPTRAEPLIVSIGISLGLLLRYAPFLYLGHWDAPVPTLKLWVTWVPILVSLFAIACFRFKKRQEIK